MKMLFICEDSQLRKSLHSNKFSSIQTGYTIFNHYFVKKRFAMMSITQVLKGVGIMAYPIMVQFLMEKYGFRGTMAIIAAINAHAILGMLSMHPIEWHYKVIKVPVDEDEPRKLSLLSYKHSNFFPLIFKQCYRNFSVMSAAENNKSISEVKVNMISEEGEYEYQQTKLEISSDDRNSRVKKIRKSSLVLNNGCGKEIFPMSRERSKSLDPTQKINFNHVRSRVASIMSLGDMGGDAMINESRARQGKL